MSKTTAVDYLSKLMTAGLIAGLLAGPAIAQSTDSDAGAEEGAVVPFALPKSGPFTPAEIEIDNDKAISDWFRSAHANAAAEAFSHWDDDGEIRAACATCHSGEGFRDFHGLDGTEPGKVDGTINIGGVVDCGTCHNAGLAEISEVTFPSGLVHPVRGVEASCLTCHQGRAAGTTVAKAIAGLPDDEINPELRFINPHYATAAATWLGGYGAAGYHYDGRDYSGRFFHARPVASCNSCHEPHTLEVEFEPCTTCHLEDSARNIRIARQSYDGSGDTSKGIREDIAANAALLLDTLTRYAAEVAGAPVIYDGNRYPYFFADANGDGAADMNGDRPVAYASWTPRSLRAAFNWKLVTADPGTYAHNPQYALQLLYDAIEDLSGPLGIDMDRLDLLR
ncbi:cytochrome C [Primorskyibacter aestuariivivens]|uniref:cytochrome c3 family protein n=1 Tax=Primorskyibacter aestuariivivens TaxID=1888912 RepID=UPI00230001B4|nr:cytochrome c3 family protein [Primorskyibacter aestuariivivens]MDA7430952.1 cytochrome C [Primorskyibacter aestuariivivens]